MPASSAPWRNARGCANMAASGPCPCATWSKSPIFIKSSAGGVGRSVNFRFGNLPLAGEEIEIAAFVGLPDMGGEHGPIAAKVAWRRLFPRRAAAIEFLLRDVQVDAPRRYVDLDHVAGLNERQWPAYEALPRHMQDAGAVARPAHAPLRDAHHVAHARLHQLFRDREHAPFRHAGTALGAGILEHDDVVRRGGEVVAFDLACHVVVVFEGKRGPAMLEEALIRRRRLHHAAAWCKVAGEDGGCAFRVDRVLERMDDVAEIDFRARDG